MLARAHRRRCHGVSARALTSIRFTFVRSCISLIPLLHYLISRSFPQSRSVTLVSEQLLPLILGSPLVYRSLLVAINKGDQRSVRQSWCLAECIGFRQTRRKRRYTLSGEERDGSHRVNSMHIQPIYWGLYTQLNIFRGSFASSCVALALDTPQPSYTYHKHLSCSLSLWFSIWDCIKGFSKMSDASLRSRVQWRQARQREHSFRHHHHLTENADIE